MITFSSPLTIFLWHKKLYSNDLFKPLSEWSYRDVLISKGLLIRDQHIMMASLLLWISLELIVREEHLPASRTHSPFTTWRRSMTLRAEWFWRVSLDPHGVAFTQETGSLELISTRALSRWLLNAGFPKMLRSKQLFILNIRLNRCNHPFVGVVNMHKNIANLTNL